MGMASIEAVHRRCAIALHAMSEFTQYGSAIHWRFKNGFSVHYVDDCRSDLKDAVVLVHSQLAFDFTLYSYGTYLLTILAQVMRHGREAKSQPVVNFHDWNSPMKRIIDVYS